MLITATLSPAEILSPGLTVNSAIVPVLSDIMQSEPSVPATAPTTLTVSGSLPRNAHTTAAATISATPVSTAQLAGEVTTIALSSCSGEESFSRALFLNTCAI